MSQNIHGRELSYESELESRIAIMKTKINDSQEKINLLLYLDHLQNCSQGAAAGNYLNTSLMYQYPSLIDSYNLTYALECERLYHFVVTTLQKQNMEIMQQNQMLAKMFLKEKSSFVERKKDSKGDDGINFKGIVPEAETLKTQSRSSKKKRVLLTTVEDEKSRTNIKPSLPEKKVRFSLPSPLSPTVPLRPLEDTSYRLIMSQFGRSKVVCSDAQQPIETSQKVKNMDEENQERIMLAADYNDFICNIDELINERRRNKLGPLPEEVYDYCKKKALSFKNTAMVHRFKQFQTEMQKEDGGKTITIFKQSVRSSNNSSQIINEEDSTLRSDFPSSSSSSGM